MDPGTVPGGAAVAHIGIMPTGCDTLRSAVPTVAPTAVTTTRGRPRRAAQGSAAAAAHSPPRASLLPGPTPIRSRSPWGTSTANRYVPGDG